MANKKRKTTQNNKDFTLERNMKHLEMKNQYLNAEVDYLKKIEQLGVNSNKLTTEDKAKIVNELKQKYKLKYLLEISNLKRSTYYYTLSKTNKDMKNDIIMNEIIQIFYEHKERYGYRRITLELKNRGYCVNHKKVKRLMSVMGLYAKTPKTKYESYKGDMNGVTKNLLVNKVHDQDSYQTYYKRNFHTKKCNEVWVTDVSEFHIPAGNLYLSPILDLHNREIVSYNISTNPNFKQIKDMLCKAFNKFDTLQGLTLHSDQGWQYQTEEYHKMLQEKGIQQSMSRKGKCLDNSPMENFFGMMKNEMFYGQKHSFKTLEELKTAMEEYIDYYNQERILVKLNGLTPVQYRMLSMLRI